MSHLEQVERDLKALAKFIKKLGEPNDDGQYVVAFGVLFDDDEAANTFEAMNGTLRAAKKRGIIDFKGQMLLKGPHDNIPITLLVEADDDNEEEVEDTNENNENNVEQTENDTNDEKSEYNASPLSTPKAKPTPTILPKTYSPSPSPGPQSPSISIAESVENPVVEQDVVVKEEEKLENKWGEEFTLKLGKCINETFEYDEESILPAKYLLHYLKKRIGFDFTGQTKHRDALQFVCVEQFGWKTINDWGYSIRVV